MPPTQPPYPPELKRLIVELVRAGLSVSFVCDPLFRVSIPSVVDFRVTRTCITSIANRLSRCFQESLIVLLTDKFVDDYAFGVNEH